MQSTRQYFNTSYVVIKLGYDAKEKKNVKNFNTSYVVIKLIVFHDYRSFRLISIHLMLLLNRIGRALISKAVNISIHLMLLLNSKI